MDTKLIYGLVGGIIGLIAGIVGTLVSVRAAKGPSERASMIRAATWCWAGVSVLLAALSLLPSPWRYYL